MNKAITAMLVLMSCVGARAQGTIDFANFDASARLNSPVFLADGVTPVSGSNFKAAMKLEPETGVTPSARNTGEFNLALASKLAKSMVPCARAPTQDISTNIAVMALFIDSLFQMNIPVP